MDYSIDTTPAIPRPARKARTIDDLPKKDSTRMAVKIYILGALAWDYADTVLDIAAQMRRSETKKLSRAVRELRSAYVGLCRLDMDSRHMDDIARLAELFERINATHMAHLSNGLRTETDRLFGLTPQCRMLVQSVQMAMTVLDTLRLYTDRCDGWLKSQGIKAVHGCMPDHFARLAVLLPQFAGDCYDIGSESRALTAKILLNEINAIELYDDNGKV